MIESYQTDERLLGLVGERLAGLRLAQNLTQEQVAEQAGLGLRTVQRIESGKAATQLSGFLRVCRVLGILDRLELLLPAPVPSPIEELRIHGQKRQRASGRQTIATENPTWTWKEKQ
jgi:transcriptional regulator with XRE-family HTH domain